MGNVLKYINNFVYYMEPSNEDRNASSFSAIIIFYIVSYFIEGEEGPVGANGTPNLTPPSFEPGSLLPSGELRTTFAKLRIVDSLDFMIIVFHEIFRCVSLHIHFFESLI